MTCFLGIATTLKHHRCTQCGYVSMLEPTFQLLRRRTENVSRIPLRHLMYGCCEYVKHNGQIL
jgi:hypothetical protein